jgi:hypothetical protein
VARRCLGNGCLIGTNAMEGFVEMVPTESFKRQGRSVGTDGGLLGKAIELVPTEGFERQEGVQLVPTEGFEVRLRLRGAGTPIGTNTRLRRGMVPTKK